MTEYEVKPGVSHLLLDHTGAPLRLKSGVEVKELGGDSYYVRSPGGYTMPWPHRHMKKGGGYLNDSLEAAALWYFLQCASTAVERLPQQVSLEGEQDSAVDLTELARSICLCYATEKQYMFDSENLRRALAELNRIKGILDYRIVNFINSGGALFRHHDREPG